MKVFAYHDMDGKLAEDGSFTFSLSKPHLLFASYSEALDRLGEIFKQSGRLNDEYVVTEFRGYGAGTMVYEFHREGEIVYAEDYFGKIVYIGEDEAKLVVEK